MNKKHLIPFIIAVLLIMFITGVVYYRTDDPVNLPAVEAASGQQSETYVVSGLAAVSIVCDSFNATGTESGRVQVDGVNCSDITPTPEPSSTPTSTPTVPPTGTAEPTATSAPTATVEPTPVAGQPCPASLHDAAHWHPPVDDTYGCLYGHEHGDEAPAWVMDAGYHPAFDHHANTPNENSLPHKHTAFKGYEAELNGVDLYAIFHMDFNPGGHASRFHSYQIWAKDASGGVSHWNGWLDFGEDDNSGPNFQTTCGNQNVRPIILSNDQGCPIQFETWYSRAGASEWSWDFGFSISPTYYAGGDPANPETWDTIFGYPNNFNRRMEAAWYANRSDQEGEFWATQFGQVVTGEDAPVCGTTVTYGVREYTVVCLRQFIATTMTSVQFPGNAIQKEYDDEGVDLPN